MRRKTDKQKLCKNKLMKEIKASCYNQMSTREPPETAKEVFARKPEYYTSSASKKSTTMEEN